MLNDSAKVSTHRLEYRRLVREASLPTGVSRSSFFNKRLKNDKGRRNSGEGSSSQMLLLGAHRDTKSNLQANIGSSWKRRSPNSLQNITNSSWLNTERLPKTLTNFAGQRYSRSFKKPFGSLNKLLGSPTVGRHRRTRTDMTLPAILSAGSRNRTWQTSIRSSRSVVQSYNHAIRLYRPIRRTPIVAHLESSAERPWEPLDAALIRTRTAGRQVVELCSSTILC